MEGFVFGLAIFVTVKQLPKLFGVEADRETRSASSVIWSGISATRTGRRSRSESALSRFCSRVSGGCRASPAA
jgi:hypothetical protein